MSPDMELDAATLAAAAELLAPGGHGLPSAGEIDIVARVAMVLTEAPALTPGVARALELLATAPITEAALRDVELTEPAAFAALLETVVVAWATAPAIQRALDVEERIPIPLDAQLADPDLLAPVRAHGPRWRPDAQPDTEENH